MLGLRLPLTCGSLCRGLILWALTVRAGDIEQWGTDEIVLKMTWGGQSALGRAPRGRFDNGAKQVRVDVSMKATVSTGSDSCPLPPAYADGSSFKHFGTMIYSLIDTPNALQWRPCARSTFRPSTRRAGASPSSRRHTVRRLLLRTGPTVCSSHTTGTSRASTPSSSATTKGASANCGSGRKDGGDQGRVRKQLPRFHHFPPARPRPWSALGCFRFPLTPSVS